MNEASSHARNVKFGLLITAIGGFLFTFDLPLLRLADNEKWALVFARGIMLFVSISAVWLVMKLKSRENMAYFSGVAGLGVIATNTVSNIAYIGAMKETNAANVVFILALIPVLTAVFSRVFLREEVHRFTWLATVLSLVGVGIIVKDSLSIGGIKGDVLAFVSACCTAAAFTIVRASGKNVATSLAVGSLLSAMVALFVFQADISLLNKTASFGMSSWFWVALNGLFIIPIASSLISNGPRFLPSADVSMFFLLETILTPIWIWMLFKEVPTPAVLFGGAIVIVTLVVHSFWRLKETLNLEAAAGE